MRGRHHDRRTRTRRRPDGTDPGPEIDAEPTEDPTTTDGAGETADGDYEPSREDYEALARVLAAEEPDNDDGEPDHEPDPANAEAAKWRTKFRDSETRIQAAADEVARMQNIVEGMWKAEVERLASAKLDAGEDLWLSGVQLNDLLVEDRIDPAKVTKAVDELLARRPNWGIVRPPVRSFTSGASPRPTGSPGWAGVLRQG